MTSRLFQIFNEFEVWIAFMSLNEWRKRMFIGFQTARQLKLRQLGQTLNWAFFENLCTGCIVLLFEQISLVGRFLLIVVWLCFLMDGNIFSLALGCCGELISTRSRVGFVAFGQVLRTGQITAPRLVVYWVYNRLSRPYLGDSNRWDRVPVGNGGRGVFGFAPPILHLQLNRD